MPEPTIQVGGLRLHRPFPCGIDRHTPIRPPRVSATIPNRMLRTAGPQP
jgi:hypothetical protein